MLANCTISIQTYVCSFFANLLRQKWPVKMTLVYCLFAFSIRVHYSASVVRSKSHLRNSSTAPVTDTYMDSTVATDGPSVSIYSVRNGSVSHPPRS